MFSRLVAVIALAAVPGFCGDWSPRLAAEYLDARQKEWAQWPAAKATGGTCLSCHTGLTYLLARPNLGRALGESKPTSYETGLMDGLRARLEKKTAAELSPTAKEPFATQKMGVEAIFAALFLTLQDSGRATLSAEAKQAFDRLWSLQIREGKGQGSWAWFDLNLDPWETPDSAFYGASLAALAAGSAPAEYRDQPEVRKRVAALTEYLQREQQAQPLHNRLTLLWASSKLPSALPEAMRRPLIDEILRKQQADGGWTLDSLGSFKPHPNAPPAAGSNSYATAYVAFVLEQAGIARSNPNLARALDWLRAHQNKELGYWPADSMNKRYEADSMPLRFMQDAATGFAVMALLGAK
jgi:squalene-hopene/tetraprenyl-beta-curcumene cyclase